MSTPSRHDEVSTEEAAPSRRAWFGLAVLSAGLGMIVLDGTIVGVALPDIIRDLDMNITDAQWVNSLYAVLLAALLLSTGRLSDRWGRKWLIAGGMGVQAIGLGIMAAAAGFGWWAFAAVLLGAGAGAGGEEAGEEGAVAAVGGGEGGEEREAGGECEHAGDHGASVADLVGDGRGDGRQRHHHHCHRE